MIPKPRKDDALTVDMHVYMTERDHAGLRERASEECRTLNQQLLYEWRQAIASRQARVSPLDDPEIERIKNACRKGAKSLV